ncbi:MAG: GIY-YIG nuclease family protein [Anaerolineae bacterium]
MSFIPSQKGTYILLLRLNAPALLTVGRLGTFHFPAGVYGYVGSAFGAGGLRGRLKHHLLPAARPHWHIDYLRSAAPIVEIWYAASADAAEHDWAAALMRLSGVVIAPRFGASDCRCAAHLLHFPSRPNLEDFRSQLPNPSQIGVGQLIQRNREMRFGLPFRLRPRFK